MSLEPSAWDTSTEVGVSVGVSLTSTHLECLWTQDSHKQGEQRHFLSSGADWAGSSGRDKSKLCMSHSITTAKRECQKAESPIYFRTTENSCLQLVSSLNILIRRSLWRPLSTTLLATTFFIQETTSGERSTGVPRLAVGILIALFD